MAFDFNLSTQMQNLFDAIKQQSQQELPDAKQRIDDAILSATMPQAPNQHQQGFAQHRQGVQKILQEIWRVNIKQTALPTSTGFITVTGATDWLPILLAIKF